MGPSGPPVSAISPSPPSFQPLDLDVRSFVLAWIEEGARGEFHEVLVARLAAGDQRQRAGGLGAGLIGAGARQAVALRPVAEIDLQRAADDGLYAGCGDLVGELQGTEEIAGVGEAERGKAVADRQLGEPGDCDCAFQQRIGRVHFEMHVLRRQNYVPARKPSRLRDALLMGAVGVMGAIPASGVPCGKAGCSISAGVCS